MNDFDVSLIEDYSSVAADGDTTGIERLKSMFINDLPPDYDGEALFEEIAEDFDAGELGEVCAELVLTITASCDVDDFHNWDHDHLAFIIDLSNTYDFTIPANFLNGLPEQLILLIDSEKLDDSGSN
jgi:hypothetical protein